MEINLSMEAKPKELSETWLRFKKDEINSKQLSEICANCSAARPHIWKPQPLPPKPPSVEEFEAITLKEQKNLPELTRNEMINQQQDYHRIKREIELQNYSNYVYLTNQEILPEIRRQYDVGGYGKIPR